MCASTFIGLFYKNKYTQFFEARADRQAIEELGADGAQGCIVFCKAIERITTPSQRFLDFQHPSLSSRIKAAQAYLEQIKEQKECA